jgi:putative ABC transport system substrate-binding protein
MKRREFIALVGAAAASVPFAARAQQTPRLPTVGFLVPGTPESHGKWVAAFAQRLRELGWMEGRTLTIEYRWAEGRNERMAEYAAEFVGLKVDVIVTSAGGANAARQATSVIPIVFAAYVDPVASGLIASLARPGGNVTGLTIQPTDLTGKRLDLLREIVPGSAACRLWATSPIPGSERSWLSYKRRLRTSALRPPFWKSGVPRISRQPSMPSKTAQTHCMSLASRS